MRAFESVREMGILERHGSNQAAYDFQLITRGRRAGTVPGRGGLFGCSETWGGGPPTLFHATNNFTRHILRAPEVLDFVNLACW